jgi:hypothetical protein
VGHSRRGLGDDVVDGRYLHGHERDRRAKRWNREIPRDLV